MGFSLSAKKKIYVSSVVYNLAGDEAKRPNYLKTTVVGKIIADNDASQSMSEAIQSTYINGPGIRFRSFIKWCNTSGYNTLMGMQPATIYVGDSIDDTVLAQQIPHDAGTSVNILNSETDVADYGWWADQFMYRNHPDQMTSDWSVDFDDATQELVITLADSTVYRFSPAGYEENANYLYSTYSLTGEPQAGDVTPGTPVYLGSADPFPDTTGWTQDSYTTGPETVTLEKRVTQVKSYSDGRPDETTTGQSTSTDTYTRIAGVFEKTDYKGLVQEGDKQVSKSLRQIMYQNQSGQAVDGTPDVQTETEVVGGVTVTTTTTTVQQVIQVNRYYRIDEQELIAATYFGSDVFIYKFGSGNSKLDDMFSPQVSAGQFSPPIPIRVDNDMITDKRFTQYYEPSKKAYKKATNSKFDDIIQKVKDNDSLGDIDYAYCVLGVSLNVKENACRKYMYKWFQTMLKTSTGVTTAYGNYKTQMAAAQASQEAWHNWSDAQTDPSNPLYNTPEPTKIPYPTLPVSSIQIKSNSLMNYNITISWSAMAETTGVGMHDATHKVGDCWFVINGDDNYEQIVYTGGNAAPVNAFSVSHVTLYYQETATVWRAMSIWGLSHKNKIYGGKSVDISAKDALNDNEESGFIIPLQRDIYSAISLVDATQMATACMFIVFNCYKVVKQKWYQTGIFKIILVVVIIVISIYTGGAAAGLLGTAAGVGAAVGLTGIAAIIVGTIANALAAMLLMKLIGVVATEAFGAKVGAIVGAIAGVIAVAVGSSLSTGGTVAAGVSSLADPQNIMRLTVAAGNGYAGYMAAATQQTIAETQALMEKYNEKSKEIAQQYDSVLGSDSRGVIDPTDLTNATQAIFESSESFLNRTLLTGADVSDLSLTLLTNFVEITTSTELSYS